MRCAKCGTENAQDSRFCGGCGAAMPVARVVPTVKIPDDAPYAPASGPARVPSHVASSPASIPPRASAPASMAPRAQASPYASGPPSMPPPVAATPSAPPANNPIASRPPAVMPRPSGPDLARPAQRTAEASSSLPAKRSGGGLVAIVVIVDLAMAGVGAALLAKGLAHDSAPSAKPMTRSDKP